MIFASLIVEQEPRTWGGVPAALLSWVDIAGAFAFVGLLVLGMVFVLNRWLGPGGGGAPSRGTFARVLLWSIRIAAVVSYCIYILCASILPSLLTYLSFHFKIRLVVSQDLAASVQKDSLTFGGMCAIVAICWPLFANVLRLRPRRIFALAKLSFKEALRLRILWVFLSLMLIFLFPPHWFFSIKSEDEVKTYVTVVYRVMTVLLLATGGILAAFSIPTDLRTQTMHTIVTKPVERFEIVLGRILGHLFLMTLVLGAMSIVSLVFVSRDVSEEAAAESYRSRVPVFGNTLQVTDPVGVGREWDYRKYISGGVADQVAVWSFQNLPADFANRDTVLCEFSFDIFRTTKGVQNQRILCNMTFENWRWDPKNRNQYQKARQTAKDQAERNRLAEEYGFHEEASVGVVDYHTLSVEVPGGLFKDLQQWSEIKGKKPPPLKISVRCESPTQLLGVAKYDLYLLDRERLFGTNFFKGAVGLWCRLCLVIVVAVTLSTYLSGIISFLIAMLLYWASLGVSFIKELAEGKLEGGGPMESIIRLSRNAPLMMDLGETPGVRLSRGADEAFRIALRRFLYAIPDVHRFDLSGYVAQGFDIPFGLLLADNLLSLAGYLLPWLVLAFYLIRSREIAA